MPLLPRNLQNKRDSFNRMLAFSVVALFCFYVSLHLHVLTFCPHFFFHRFPRDIEALRQIRVHPALLPPDSPERYISDFIPTDKLILWAERCREIHEELLRDGKNLSKSIKEVQEGTVAIRSNSGIK